MRGNTVTLHLTHGRVAQTGNLWQFDYGQRLILSGVTLPPAYEVHFANAETGDSKTVIGDFTGVDIPDEYLLTGDKIHVWVYLHDGESDGETEYHGIINVSKRARPTDQEPTPVQQSEIDQAIAALNAGISTVEGIAEGIPQTIDAALEEAKESGEFDGDPGQDGFSPIITVTDITGGHRVTITDATGSRTVDVMDGSPGTPGDPGEPGEPGADGVSPTVAVSPITDGHRVTITDKTGEHSFDVMDGEKGDPGDPTELIDDTSTTDTDKTWSAKKLNDECSDLSTAIAYKTPEMFGAVGDGMTDDSEAVQDAVDAGYAVRFGDNKTYYLASAVTINHDCHLIGGKDTVIKTKTPSGGTANNAFIVSGTLKKTTTMTGNYTTTGSGDNCGNGFTLSDMTDIAVGDILVITATDQYYSYARSMYYLGAVLLVSDTYNGHIYTSDSMPWDIENTENVSVKVYSAPSAIIEGINFVSDYDGTNAQAFLVSLQYTKNCIVRNCKISQMQNGLQIYYSVNSLADCVTVAKSKYDNNIYPDGYGIKIDSSTNTIIRRVMAVCSQGCLDLGGYVPNLNTYVYDCNLFSECRTIGIDLHENSYNLIVEDCVLGGAAISGKTTINRCRFVQNSRTSSSIGIAFRGSHNPAWSELKVNNCTFDKDISVQLLNHLPQNPIQAFENIFGNVEITNCRGGYLAFIATTSQTITANIVKSLIIKGWNDCDQFIHSEGNVIENLTIINSVFNRSVWLNKQHNGATYYYDGIRCLNIHNDSPKIEKLFVNMSNKNGKYFIPEDTVITFSSSDTSARYTVCGNNIESDNPDDYILGTVSATEGSSISITPIAILEEALSKDSNGNLVFSQPLNYTGTGQIIPRCMAYASENSIVTAKCVIKDTGSVAGAKFRLYIATIDCKTGKVTYGGRGTEETSSSAGTTITHSHGVLADSLVIVYVACTYPVAGSETTIEDLVAKIVPRDIHDNGYTLEYEKYNGLSRTGNGTLKSIDGLNNIMSSVASFSAKFCADFVSTPVGATTNATGVSF